MKKKELGFCLNKNREFLRGYYMDKCNRTKSNSFNVLVGRTGRDISITRFKNFFKFINNNVMTYLDIDYKTEIKVHYNGECDGLNGYCEFDVDYHYLPALHLHHRLKNYKRIVTKRGFEYIGNLSNLFRTSFDLVIKKLQTQIGGLELLCKNHHMLKHIQRYSYPPIFLFLSNLTVPEMNRNPSNVRKMSDKLSLEYYNKFIEPKLAINKKWHMSKITRSVWKMVKKKYAIEFIFGTNYTCPICKKAKINQHLVCFVAHHTNLKLFDGSMDKINFNKEYTKRSVDWIIENLLEQECVYICQNCHEMISTTYYQNILESIFRKSDDVEFVTNFFKNANLQIESLRSKILELKNRLLNGELIILDPLGKIFTKFEVLERNLICIYYISKIFPTPPDDTFKSNELDSVLGIKGHFTRTTSRLGRAEELLDLSYINSIGRTSQLSYIFQITKKGIDKAKDIIRVKSMKYPESFQELISSWKASYGSIQRTIRDKVINTLKTGNYTARQLSNNLGYSILQMRSALQDLKVAGRIVGFGKLEREKIWSLL